MTIFKTINGQIYYRPTDNYRVFTDKTNKELTKSFQTRFRRGEVSELPKGFLYNTLDNRFYVNSARNKDKFKDFEIIDRVIQPTSVFDFDISKVNYRTIKGTFKSPPIQRKTGPSQIKYVRALQGWSGVKAYRNANNIQGYDSLNGIGKVIPYLKQKIAKEGALKYYITVLGDYILSDEHRTIKTETQPKILLNQSEVISSVKTSISELKTLIEEAQLNGSGYNFQGIKSFFLNYVNYNPTRGASYIPTPIRSNAIINPINKNDEECFKWCLAIHKAKLAGERGNLYRIN